MTTKLATPPIVALLLFSAAAAGAQVPAPDLPPAEREPLRWEAVADSHVYAYDYKKWNESNWGAYEVLGAGSTAAGGDKRIYLKFAIPPGFDPVDVGAARLRLYHYANAGEPTLALGVHQVTGEWVEGTGTYPASSDVLARPGEISWKKQPAFDKEPVAVFRPGGEVNKFIEVDVTALVHAWLKSGVNNGMAIAPVGELPAGTTRSGYSFFAREKEEADKRPVIFIDVISTPPPPPADPDSDTPPEPGNERDRSRSGDVAEAPAIDMSHAEREELEASCGKLEDTFADGDVEALTALILPQEAQNYRTLLSGREAELKKFGELFKNRKLVATGADIAQYEIEDAGVRYPVTMIKIGDEWRLYSF